MSFWRRVSPGRAVADFAEQWRQPNPYRWRVLGVSVAATFALMVAFLPENQRIEPRPPDVFWITTFAPDRTEAEIVASNIENQKRQDALRAEAEERAERRRQLYRELGRATGVDVDAMERRHREEAAREVAREAAERQDER